MHHSREPYPGEQPDRPYKSDRKPGGSDKLASAARPKGESFGATGQFPEGKLNEADEGEIQFGITTDNGKVVINFGTPVSWMGMNPEQARELGALLSHHAFKAMPGAPPDEQIFVTSLLSGRTHEPLIEISWGVNKAQLPLGDARNQALYILEACEASESDAFVFQWLTRDIIGTSEDEKGNIALVIEEFKAFREARRLKAVKTAG
jgi:hypothetical protein